MAVLTIFTPPDIEKVFVDFVGIKSESNKFLNWKISQNFKILLVIRIKLWRKSILHEQKSKMFSEEAYNRAKHF